MKNEKVIDKITNDLDKRIKKIGFYRYANSSELYYVDYIKKGVVKKVDSIISYAEGMVEYHEKERRHLQEAKREIFLYKKLVLKLGRINVNGRGVKEEYANTKFSKVTTNNLKKISEIMDIEWEITYKWRIIQKGKSSNRLYRTTWSIAVLGKDKKQTKWVYFRKETEHPQAGQTFLYKEGRYPYSVTSIITDNSRHHKW